MATELAELHVHLEGTLTFRTACELAARHGMPAPPAYEYSNLTGFLHVYEAAAAVLRDAYDLERVVLEYARELKRQQVAYAEISFNPSLHPPLSSGGSAPLRAAGQSPSALPLPGGDWLEGIIDGRRRALAELGVDIRWLVELERNAAPGANEAALELAFATEGVCGIGLVGDEAVSAAPLGPLFARARSVGLGVMPHAGQVGPAGGVREAVELLGATRVAHGVAAAADPELLRDLAARGVCLCVCPSSNRRIGLHPDYAALAAAGIPLAVGSDDPPFARTTLAAELELAEHELGLDRRTLVANAWRYRFSR
jgi:adenosine deaminase